MRMTEKPVWRILIVGDRCLRQCANIFALGHTDVLGRPLEFLHAAGAQQVKQLLQRQRDIAVIMLDVATESSDAGLNLVSVIRRELGIKDTRIILHARKVKRVPDAQVIHDYDINDYKLESELNKKRLLASLAMAIRAYKQIRTIEISKNNLNMIVRSSAQLLNQPGPQGFAERIILHLCDILNISPEGLLCVRESSDTKEARVIAGIGLYKAFIGNPLWNLHRHDVADCVNTCLSSGSNIFHRCGFALYLGSQARGDMACFVGSEHQITDVDESMLELFSSSIGICVDNLELVVRLSEQANSDSLSGLRNRNALVKELDRIIIEGAQKDAVLCMVDIDNFAEINASLGQRYGDALLVAVGTRIQKEFPDPCFVARVAGDTFAILGPSGVVTQQKLNDVFSVSFPIEGHEQIVSITAGIVPIAEVEGAGDAAVKDATIVLKTAKNTSRGEVLLLRQDMVKEAQERLSMLRHLRAAFESGQLFLVYQPKLRMRDLAVIGFESLVRWRGRDGHTVAPENFIPLAEQSGLIIKLGAWIFEESVRTLKDFHRQGWQGCHMSVNLSVAQLQKVELVNMLASVTTNTGMNPKYINLEITESLAVTNLDSTLALLKEIKAMGFSLSLDDFGTGYSSLNLLQKLPIDYLKIDRSLVEASDTQNGREILEMMVHLAERLGLEVVAEGVEKQSQIKFLQSLECGLAQGFYYAKPMEKEILCHWMSAREFSVSP